MLGVAQTASNVSDVDIVIRYESSGDPNAINNWDSNAQAGHPSTGLVQVIQPTFDYYRSGLLPADLYNPAANVYAGMHYAISNYGSIHNIPGLVSLRNGGGYRGYLVRK
jgi:SLT domain-containing protein